MNTRTWILFPTGIAVIASSVMGWRAANRHEAADRERAALTAENATLRERARTLAEQVTQAEKEGERPATARSLPAPSKAQTLSMERQKSPAPTPTSAAEFRAKDPKLQLAYLESRRVEIAVSYGPFFRLLGLSETQRQSFIESVVRHEAHKGDLAAVMQEKNLYGRDPVVVAQREEALAALRAEQIAVLGLGYEQLQEYERTLPVRTWVGNMAGIAALAGIPLSPQQAEQLTRVMADASASYRKGAKAEMNGIDWRVFDGQAPTILSPEQLALFTQVDPPTGGPSRWSSQVMPAVINAAHNSGSAPPKAERRSR